MAAGHHDRGRASLRCVEGKRRRRQRSAIDRHEAGIGNGGVAQSRNVRAARSQVPPDVYRLPLPYAPRSRSARAKASECMHRPAGRSVPRQGREDRSCQISRRIVTKRPEVREGDARETLCVLIVQNGDSKLSSTICCWRHRRWYDLKIRPLSFRSFFVHAVSENRRYDCFAEMQGWTAVASAFGIGAHGARIEARRLLSGRCPPGAPLVASASSPCRLDSAARS